MSHENVTNLATQLAFEHSGDPRFRVILAPELLDDVAGALATMGFLVARDSVERSLTVRDRRTRTSYLPQGCA